MKKLLLLIIPVIAFAVDVPMPIPGTGACKITAVSGATPARITVENIAACGIASTDVDGNPGADGDTDPDNRIRILGARTSTTARAAYMNINTHPANSTDADGLCSLALNISGNQFDLYKCDGTTAITASGTWATGGLVWRVRWMTLRTGPNILLDGTGGTVLTGLQSTSSGTGWGDTARLPMQALTSAVDAYIALPPANGSDEHMSLTPRSALRWYAQGKPSVSTSKDAALLGVQNIRQWVGSFACDQVNGGAAGCGQPGSEIMDYRSAHYGINALLAVTLMWDELSAGEKTDTIDYFINDQEQNKGGHNYPGTSLTEPTYKSSPGTVSYSGTAVTGTGTSFTSYSVGDYMTIACATSTVCEGFGKQYRITNIASDTSLTIDRSAGTRTNVTYRVGAPWSSGETGYLWFSKFYDSSSLCGANPFQSVPFGCPDYPPQGGQGAGGGTNNHVLVRAVMDLALGVAFANYDMRARWLLADAAGMFYHVVYPSNLNAFSGITSMATVGYAPGRGNLAPVIGLGLMKWAVTASVEYAHSQFIDGNAAWNLAAIIPGTDKVHLSQNDGSENDTLSLHNSAPAFPVMLFYPSSTYAAALKADTEQQRAFLNTTNFNRQDIHQTVAYIGHRPDISGATLTNPTFKFPSLAALCSAQWTYFCKPKHNLTEQITRTAMVSRIGTSASQVKAFFWNMVGFSGEDQQTQEVETGFYPSANGQILMSPDGVGDRYGHEPEHFGNITFSGVSFKNAYPNIATTIEERMAGNQYYAAGTVDLVGHYTTSPGGAVRRSWIHAKRGANDYVLEWFHLPASGTVANHLWISAISSYGSAVQADCGTPSSTSCVSLNRAAGTWSSTHSTLAKLMSKVIGTATTSTENSSDTDGSYTNGQGNTFRVGVTGTNFGILHRVTTNTAESLATTTTLTSGSWSGVQVADGTSPVVMLVAATNQASLSGITPTSNNYQLVVAGLTAGNYKVQAAGVDVSGCESLTVLAGEHTLECPTVPTGALSISAVGAPPTITTTSLPDGAISSSYSQTISATGGTTPYAWDLSTGSLPPGLSLNASTGAITGTPTTAGTYNFTARVTDADTNTDTQALSIIIPALPGPGYSLILRPGVTVRPGVILR